MIALSGVRSSWLMLARKRLFAALFVGNYMRLTIDDTQGSQIELIRRNQGSTDVEADVGEDLSPGDYQRTVRRDERRRQSTSPDQLRHVHRTIYPAVFPK